MNKETVMENKNLEDNFDETGVYITLWLKIEYPINMSKDEAVSTFISECDYQFQDVELDNGSKIKVKNSSIEEYHST